MTSPHVSEQEVEAAERAFGMLHPSLEDTDRMRRALAAAAQVRREQAVRDKIAMHDKAMMPIYDAIEDPSATELAVGQIVTVVTVTDDGVETERVPWSEIMNPSGDDIDVRCVCGWRGKQRQLIAASGTKYCPGCGSKFSAYPSTEPDSSPDVLGERKGEE